ncbi:hypothetical protein [Sphingomonas sp. CV7422]|uniref:hypothetical protein n=1 Tax=Sphingomonas sp. CV7422 TaxID=3018036 RepID=UPI0022FDE53D|nr:hypothetical protein [Sphingomonas sp. CV7422]
MHPHRPARHARACAIALALALAACSGGETANNESSGGSAAVEPTPTNLTDDPQNSVVPIPAPSPSAVATIPAGFQGHWGMVVEDCDRASGADKGALTITGNRLAFFESRGEATGIRQLRSDQIAFDLPLSGEGMTWQEPTTLTLLDAGKTLVREAKGGPDRAGSFRYSRCPA